MNQTTDDAWEAWAVQDPYYSVLTDPKFRSADLTPQAREEFFASGFAHVNQVLDICRQRFIPAFSPNRVLDFGCGVGRLVIPFARSAAEVVGVDVSPTMLEQTRIHCDQLGLSNVVLELSDDALSRVTGQFDLVHTCIVLQHIEIARGRQLFAELVKRVAPGGCGALHITFAWDRYNDHFGQLPSVVAQEPSVRSVLKHRIKALLSGVLPLRPADVRTAPPPQDPEMQMNFYNLSELMFIVQQQGIERVHMELTDHGGALGAFVFFRR